MTADDDKLGGGSAEVVTPAPQAGGRRFESDPPPPDDAAIAACIAVLGALHRVAPDDPRFVAVEQAAAHLHKTAKRKRRLARKQAGARHDREASAGSARAAAYLGRPAVEGARELQRERRCYVCKQAFRQLHAFYHLLCPACAARHFAARSDMVDLTGRRAIVTGGRMKIGFEVAARLARAGAQVTITTRFPRDAERRFAEAGLGDRVEIAGLDFRDLRGLLGWIDRELARARPLDILVNNAAQTVRRPAAYYAALIAGEHAALPSAHASVRPPAHAAAPSAGTAAAQPAVTAAAAMALARAWPETGLDRIDAALAALVFPAGVDQEGLPLDLRPRNSWVLDAGDVDPVELVEVHAINAIAPFLLASRLRPLLMRSRFADRYIVNVTAMEGVFAYANKQSRHPHTNMAKAALNMFTRTSAEDYARHGIYMASVDTGWITQENPAPIKQRVEAAGFCPPLDIVDGAARVLAPIVRGVRGAPAAGVLFKDFEPAPW